MTKTAELSLEDNTPEIEVVPNKHLAERAHLLGSVNKSETLFDHYPESIRGDAGWLRHFCQSKLGGEHALLGKLARALGLKDNSGKDPSDQYWYQVVTGRYFKPAGNARQFAAYVSAIRGHARQLEQRGTIPHVDTRNWRLFRDYVDSRRSYGSSCRIGGVEGETGAQKTHLGKHYAALNNHRETIHLEAPARSTRSRLVAKVAELYQVRESLGTMEKELEIERFLRGQSTAAFDSKGESRPRTIIIDNVQRLLRPNVQPDQQPIFNYFHELQDDTGFCLIMTWVPTFTRVITGNNAFWAQFVGRIGGQDEILRLEQSLNKKERADFAKAMNVEDDARADVFLKKWCTTIYGIRVFMLKLEKARRLATARGSKEIRVSHLEQVDLEGMPDVSEVES